MGRHRSRSLSSSSSGRGAQSSTWDGESGYRLHVSDLAAGVSKKEVERMFKKFGTINEIWVATNPPCFAFINFKHRSDAEKAIREIDGKTIGSTRVGVSWARTRTFGGRSRSSRGPPYGSSYRSGGGSRRRSRSRSRSGSRRRRHHRSRSRSDSRDRQRRRSPSQRDRKRSSRHSSEDRNGNNDRKEDRSRVANDRQRSKGSHSASRSRSPSPSKGRSSTQREASVGKNKRSPSRGSSIDDRRDNEPAGSPSAAVAQEKNVDERSPIAVGDESNQ